MCKSEIANVSNIVMSGENLHDSGIIVLTFRGVFAIAALSMFLLSALSKTFLNNWTPTRCHFYLSFNPNLDKLKRICDSIMISFTYFVNGW